jgi:hypothetical protein
MVSGLTAYRIIYRQATLVSFCVGDTIRFQELISILVYHPST